MFDTGPQEQRHRITGDRLVGDGVGEDWFDPFEALFDLLLVFTCNDNPEWFLSAIHLNLQLFQRSIGLAVLGLQ